jgi:2'-5' RNA ligase
VSTTNFESEAETQTRWRVFCAVELPDEVRARAAARIAELRAEGSGVRASWERPEKLHLTLKFIGEIEQAQMRELAEALAEAARSVEAFEIAVEGAGAFPPKSAPRVLWLGVRDEAGGLARLRERLEAACARRHFPRERRPFNPHLTLARLRAPAGARELSAFHQRAPFTTQAFRVSEIVLMRSELGADGSRYTALSRHALGENEKAGER